MASSSAVPSYATMFLRKDRLPVESVAAKVVHPAPVKTRRRADPAVATVVRLVPKKNRRREESPAFQAIAPGSTVTPPLLGPTMLPPQERTIISSPTNPTFMSPPVVKIESLIPGDDEGDDKQDSKVTIAVSTIAPTVRNRFNSIFIPGLSLRNWMVLFLVSCAFLKLMETLPQDDPIQPIGPQIYEVETAMKHMENTRIQLASWSVDSDVADSVCQFLNLANLSAVEGTTAAEHLISYMSARIMHLITANSKSLRCDKMSQIKSDLQLVHERSTLIAACYRSAKTYTASGEALVQDNIDLTEAQDAALKAERGGFWQMIMFGSEEDSRNTIQTYNNAESTLKALHYGLESIELSRASLGQVGDRWGHFSSRVVGLIEEVEGLERLGNCTEKSIALLAQHMQQTMGNVVPAVT